MKYNDQIFCDFVTNALSSEDMKRAESLVVANGDSDASIFASMAYYDANSDLVADSEEDDDFYSHIYSLLERNSHRLVSSSANDNNKSTMETFKFNASEIANIKNLVAQFAEGEDKSKSLKENLVDFYMRSFSGVEGEESSTDTIDALIKGIQIFNTQLSEALKQDIETGEVNYIDALAAIGADKSLSERYAMYASFLVLLETLEASNLNENEMSFVETYESKKNTKFRIPDDQEVTQEMIDEIIVKINECLSNSTFTLSTLEASRDLRNAIDSDEHSVVLIKTRQEDMRAKLVLATCTYIAAKKGKISNLAPDTKPEFVALGVAAGVEEEKVLVDVAQGNMDESKAAKILKIIGAVALIGGLLIGVSYLSGILGAGIFVGLFMLLGEGVFAALISGIIGAVVTATIFSALTICAIKVVEVADVVYDKIVDVIRRKVIPAAKCIWAKAKEWIKSKLSVFFDDENPGGGGSSRNRFAEHEIQKVMIY